MAWQRAAPGQPQKAPDKAGQGKTISQGHRKVATITTLGRLALFWRPCVQLAEGRGGFGITMKNMYFHRQRYFFPPTLFLLALNFNLPSIYLYACLSIHRLYS